jgi:hypothetical protein
MPVIRNSARAFIAALILVAAFHGVMSVLGLGMSLASNLKPPSPDHAFQMFAIRLGIDAALLIAGHLLLRSFGIATRLAYGSMGGAAAAVGYAFALSHDLNVIPALDGSRVTASILPILVGMIAATMYAQFAGREMAPARNGSAGNADTAPADAASFDGPVQVRTSMAATAIASVIPAAIAVLVIMPFVSFLFSHWKTDGSHDAELTKQITTMVLPAYFFMLTLFATALPAAIVVGVTHAAARVARRSSGLDYAIIGAAVGIVASMALLMFLPASLFPVGIATGAVMGAVYRRFAGLEPLALPEAVLATDRATLVGEHDPARQTRAVIFNG